MMAAISPDKPFSTMLDAVKTQTTLHGELYRIVLEYLCPSLAVNEKMQLLYFVAKQNGNSVTIGAYTDDDQRVASIAFYFFQKTSRPLKPFFNTYGLRIVKPEKGHQHIRNCENKIVLFANDPKIDLKLETHCATFEYGSTLNFETCTELLQATVEWGNDHGCQNRLLIDVKNSFANEWFYWGFRSMRAGAISERACWSVEEDRFSEWSAITQSGGVISDTLLYLPPQRGVVDIPKQTKAIVERITTCPSEIETIKKSNDTMWEKYLYLHQLIFNT